MKCAIILIRFQSFDEGTTYLALDKAKYVSLADDTYNLVSSPNCGFWLMLINFEI
jgi:hypothetical protein